MGRKEGRNEGKKEGIIGTSSTMKGGSITAISNCPASSAESSSGLLKS